MKNWQSITISITTSVVGLIAIAGSNPELASVNGATQFQPKVNVNLERDRINGRGSENTQVTLASSANSSQYLPLRKGMTYGEARRIILKQGWKPNPEVTTNFRSAVVKAIFDRGYIEIGDCAGTGESPCRYEFVNQNGDLLYVVTAGRNSLLRNWWIREKVL